MNHWTHGISTATLAGIVGMAGGGLPGSSAMAETFDDDGTHNVDYSAWDNGGTGKWIVEGDTTVNLLTDSWGGLTQYDNSVVNVDGGIVGGNPDPQSGYNNDGHFVRNNSTLNFYSGSLYRRWLEVDHDGTLNLLGDGDFTGDGSTGGEGGLDGIKMRLNATVTIYLHPDFSYSEVDIVSGGLGQWSTPMDVTVRLPGGDDPQTITVIAWANHNLYDDTGDPQDPFYGLDTNYINFGEPALAGHLNFIETSGGLSATGVTGDIGEPDESLVIVPLSGQGFGNDGPDVVFFEDFRSTTGAGEIVTTSSTPPVGAWDWFNQYYPMLYDDDGIIGNASGRGYNEASKRGARGRVYFEETDRVFMSFWWKVPDGKRFPGADTENTFPGGSHWKPAWFSRGDNRAGPGTSGPDLVSPQWNSSWNVVGNQGNQMLNISAFPGSATSANDQWNRFDSYLNEGGISTFQALLKGVSFTRTTTSDPIFSGPSGSPEPPLHFDNVDIIGWARTGTDNAQTLIDGIYIAVGDNPAARVEIGNAEEYNDCTELYLLTIDDWADGEITATQRLPENLDVSNWYVHIHVGDNVHENSGVGRLID